MMSSMNVFTPLGFKLKPIGAFGPCLLCERNAYFSIGGHKSSKNNILEDLEIGKKFLQKNIDVYCLGGKDTISFRMYPNGIKSLIEGFSKEFLIGASSSSIINLIIIILWISGMFYPLTLFIKNIISLNILSLVIGIIFYLAYALQIIWMAKRIGNFNILVGVIYPIFLLFFIAIFFWEIIKKAFKRNITWKGRIVNK